MTRLAAKTVALVLLGSLGALSAEAVVMGPAHAAAVAAVRTETFAVKNMTCSLCPVTVKKAMSDVAGVRSVKVDFYSKTATVTFDPSKTTADAIAMASTNAGYPATPNR